MKARNAFSISANLPIISRTYKYLSLKHAAKAPLYAARIIRCELSFHPTYKLIPSGASPRAIRSMPAVAPFLQGYLHNSYVTIISD